MKKEKKMSAMFEMLKSNSLSPTVSLRSHIFDLTMKLHGRLLLKMKSVAHFQLSKSFI